MATEKKDKKTRGNNIVAFKRITVKEASELMQDDDIVLMPVIEDSAGCRTEQDVKKEMVKEDLIDTLLPMRPLKPITRKVVEKSQFE